GMEVRPSPSAHAINHKRRADENSDPGVERAEPFQPRTLPLVPEVADVGKSQCLVRRRVGPVPHSSDTGDPILQTHVATRLTAVAPAVSAARTKIGDARKSGIDVEAGPAGIAAEIAAGPWIVGSGGRRRLHRHVRGKGFS